MAIVFDTLEYAGRLKRAGFTDQQAEAQGQALAAIVNDNLATKQDRSWSSRDILAVKQELKQDILAVKQDMRVLKQELKHDLRELEHRLTLRLGTVVTVAVGVVAALVKPL
jgi:hypothetical protein